MYHRELEAAREAALRAGGILREEFHRSGGPRGAREHAEADAVAERAIFDALAAAFPEYGYLGEELGALRAAGAGGRLWLVDPNDGTSSFLKGWRGAAVSIALLEEGRPVLG